VNLKEIREEINSALDYNPDLKQYSDNIARVVNRHYLQMSSQYAWLFMQKRNLLQLRADITGDSTSKLTGDGTHLVSLPTTTGAGVINLPADIVGHTLVNTDDGATYRITEFVDERSFLVDDIFPSGDLTTWKIEFTKYPMPRDCIEVLGIMDRGITTKETLSYLTDSTTKTMTAPNEGRFMFLDARKEENLYLDRSDTGNPFVSVEEMHENLQSPDYRLAIFGPTKLVARSAASLAKCSFPYHMEARYLVEYCYTFTFAGMESPPSEVVKLEIDFDNIRPDIVDAVELRDDFAGTDKAALLFVPGLGAAIASTPEIQIVRFMKTTTSIGGVNGMMKKLYRKITLLDKPYTSGGTPDKHLTKGSTWRHIATIHPEVTEYTDSGFDIDDSTSKTVSDPVDSTKFSSLDPAGDVFRLDRLNESGPRQYLRFWNTPKSDYMVEVRYHKRPFRLVKDSDAPEWPPQYHHYLVYAALRDICMQHGMLNHSSLYERRADEMLEAMKAKYLSRTDRMYVRRGFDRAMADRERFGIPSKAE